MVDFERIKIFIIYIAHEPFKNLKLVYSSIKDLVRSLNKSTTWFWVCSYIALYSAFYNRKLLSTFAFLMVIAYIFQLWNSGEWMHEYRTKKGYKFSNKEDKENVRNV